jgi:hypothetical protein
MVSQWLQVVWLVTSGVVVGHYVTVVLAWMPTERRVPAATVWSFHRTFDVVIDRFMPFTVAASLLSTLGVLFTRPNASTAERALIGLAAAGTLTAALTSITFNVRINRQLGEWSEAQVAEQEGAFRALRERWNSGHAIRTAGMLTSFLIAVAISVFWHAG